jgi:hypothetical protein
MQSPGSYDITIYQGATFELELEYADENNTPVNMSGYTVSGQLWNRLGTSRLATFTTQWTAQASGMFKLTLPASTTSGITEQGCYDVLITEPGGTKYYLLEGAAQWNPGLSYRP